ncbi:COP8 protein [Ceratobasidium sp. AG-Ba]|nr:COP8 protein [Ceratobasidium sp. AG-Ba]
MDSPRSIERSPELPLDVDMYSSAVASLYSAVVLLASIVQAAHTITLKNECSFGVGTYVHNWGGTAYIGVPQQDIPAKSSKSIIVPDGWIGRICDKTASGAWTTSLVQ